MYVPPRCPCSLAARRADTTHSPCHALADPTKFFGIELGAQSKVDDKNERYIVNGVHDAPRLRDVLDVFIDKVRTLAPSGLRNTLGHTAH